MATNYADDARLYLPSKLPSAYMKEKWFSSNLLKLSSNKTEVLLNGSKSTLGKPFKPNLSLTAPPRSRLYVCNLNHLCQLLTANSTATSLCPVYIPYHLL